MRMRKVDHIKIWISFWVVLLSNTIVYSQNKLFTHSIGLISENDSYLLMGKDGYYTNGLTFNYSWSSQDTSKSTIRQISIGQYMYNAKNGSYNQLSKIDRPITAYLFARYGQTHFVKKSIIQWSVDMGTIGPNALGRQMQEFIHSSLGMYKPREWQFQLRNALSLNGSILYSPQEIKLDKVIRLNPLFKSDIGMTFTNINAGFILTLGKKVENKESVLWNATLNKTNIEHSESFFYVHPSIQYNIYNATVQGGLFLNDPHKGNITKILYLQKLGWQYARNRININMGIIYSGKESKYQRLSQWWGGITINYNL